MKADISPRQLLLKYQRSWSDDEARFKIGCMSRQVGKDFSSGEEGIRSCLEHDRRKEKTDWMIAAPSERQSMESLNKWKEWAEAYQLAIDSIEERKESIHPEAALTSSTITFGFGSRVIAVPGKPDTVRGFSANLLLTEFAFFEDPDATWRAIIPSVTNPLRGGQKKVRLISTPNGMGNKFHDLWSKNHGKPAGRNRWSTHLVTIEDAVAQGLPIDIEELREALDDPEGWAQEFLCQFIDNHAVLLPYELIAACESETATTSVPHEFWLTRSEWPRVMGLDFARKRDLSVALTAETIGDLKVTREVLEMRGMSTGAQLSELLPRISQCERVCLDYTGPGVGLGDLLVDKFGEFNPDRHLYGKIELCSFTNPLKVDIFSKLRIAFDQRRWQVPINRAFREDLHSVNRVTTPGGNVTYRAPHTADGHADRCTALALCNRASGLLSSNGPIWIFNSSPRSRILSAKRNRTIAG